MINAPNSKTRSRRVLEAALPLLFLLAMIASGIPLCPARLFFGVPCPGCGLTRASFAMLRFDWASVWHFHPLAPIVAPIVGWFFARPILDELEVTKKGRVYLRAPSFVWATLVAAFFGLYVARMFGAFGGPSDPIDFESGLVGYALGIIRSWSSG